MSHAELTDEEYARFCGLIYQTAGIRIADNKRVMVSNRVRRRLRATGVPGFSQYLALLMSEAGREELPLFLDAITTNETYFFRDPHQYEWFSDTFLAEILHAAALHHHTRSLRIWSAACSTGEEPYSLALKIAAKESRFKHWRITILGTDLSGAVLKSAEAGVYDARSTRLVDPLALKTHFTADAASTKFTIKPEIRARVTWQQHNLLNPLPGEPFDCIFLKNVLIYFDAESKKKVVRNVIAALARGGYLVIGPTEGVHTMLGSLERVQPWLYRQTA